MQSGTSLNRPIPPSSCTQPGPATHRNEQGFNEHSKQAGVDFVASSFEDVSFPNLKAHFLRQVKQNKKKTHTHLHGI